MLIHEARVGMIVEFGRQGGEWTRGTIVKINPTKAKVKTLETRGQGRGSFVGAEWSVPYSMMRPATSEGGGTPCVPQHDPADSDVSVYLPYGDARIMEAIIDCYTRLSPEYLTADGERPMSQVHALRRNLEGRLSHLFKALGRTVSETAAYKWDDERKKEKV